MIYDLWRFYFDLFLFLPYVFKKYLRMSSARVVFMHTFMKDLDDLENQTKNETVNNY